MEHRLNQSTHRNIGGVRSKFQSLCVCIDAPTLIRKLFRQPQLTTVQSI